MSEESLGDKAKEVASEAADKAKEVASDAADAAKEAASDIKEEWNKMTNSGDNKKMLAGLLGIFLGAFGVHKFILGYTKEGVIMLVATVVLMIVTCGTLGWVVGIVGLIEGIMYLTKSDEEFYNTYQAGKKSWF